MMNIGMHLKRAVQRFPDYIAVVDGDIRMTYRDFYERSLRMASALTGLGLKKGDRAAFMMQNCHQAMEVEAACYLTGIIKVPLNWRLSMPEVVGMMNNSESGALVFDPMFLENIKKIKDEINTVKHFIGIDCDSEDVLDYETLLKKGRCEEPQVALDFDDVASLNYTSGTSGVLKAAMLTHRNWITAYEASLMGEGMEDMGEVRRAYIAPITHAAGLSIIPTMVKGGTNILLKIFDIKMLLETIEKERITHIMLVPTMINFIMEYPEVRQHDLSSLKSILYGTSPMSPDRIKQAIEIFGPILSQGYGQTECVAIISGLSKYDHITHDDPEKEKRLLSAGSPSFKCEVRVVDEQGNDTEPGEVGEIILRGPNVMKGYWKAPELTAETIVDGWLYTRDMGKFDERGFLYLVDRKSDMIISGGFNIYPSEVENVLYTHPAVREAAVVSIPDDKWGESVKAVVVLKEGKTATEEELIDLCKNRLSSYKKPKSIDFMDDLPKSPIGKILRRKVKENYWDNQERKIH